VTEVLYGLDAAERQRVAALRAQGSFYWLDVPLSETNLDDLRETLGVPEPALRGLSGSGQVSGSRTLHADGQSVVFAVNAYVATAPAEGAAYRLRALKVHVLVTGEYLLTLHEERVSLPATLAPDLPEERSKRYVVYSVLEAMLASTFDALEEVEVRLDALAATWTEGRGGGVPRATLRDAGARLAAMRRWVRAEQAVFERLGVEIAALPGFAAPDEPYLDRLDGQVNHLLASIDAAASAMGMLLDLQLNERAYLLSVLATIFVPLTFITGFFGMNFGWMVDQISSQLAFWLLGFIVPIAAALAAWLLVVRRFLTGADRKPGS
jgi:magnesium transporter